MFGVRLAALRNEMGLSQYQLADKLEFSRGQIGNYEQGTREPDFATLIKIADFFEVSTDYLLGRSSERVIIRADTNETKLYNVAYFGSEKVILSDNEAVYLRESLAVYRRVR
ncbi:helix-turn-helix domain-containing protein [Paenibacillus sp. GCM10012303]|uniref:helix-turn-helix domain-containing protein n=1 Tax=Paenibacillus sp. GCM10012303 TaxID=3317340 RepID=UPI0036071910